MRDRKPVKVAGFAQLHNLFMALLSLWMTVETVTQVWTLCMTATMSAAPWEIKSCMTPACSTSPHWPGGGPDLRCAHKIITRMCLGVKGMKNGLLQKKERRMSCRED